MIEDRIFTLTDEYKTCYDAKKELAKAEKENNERLKDAKEALISALIAADSVKCNRNGHTFSIDSKTKFYISSDIREEAHSLLREHGLGGLIQERVSDAELTKELNKILEADDTEALDEHSELFDLIKSFDETNISVRKDSKKKKA